MPVQTPQRVRVASPQRRINRPSPRPLDGQISRSVRTAPVRREEHLLFVRYRRDGAPAKLLTDSVTSHPALVGCLGLRRLSGSPGRGIATIPGLFDK